MSQQKERTISIPRLWHTDFPGQFMHVHSTTDRNVELWLQVENKHLFTQLQEIHPAGIKC